MNEQLLEKKNEIARRDSTIERKSSASGWLSSISFRTKLVIHAILVSALALLLAAVALLNYDVYIKRQNLVDEASVYAKIVGANSTAALVFEEAGTVERLLQTLALEPGFNAAHVYRVVEGSDSNLVLFASYSESSSTVSPVDEVPFNAEIIDADLVKVYRPVVLDGETIGVVYLEISTAELTEHFYRSLGIFCLVMVLALVFALVISAKFQQILIRPVNKLIETTVIVTQNNDFSVRAAKISDDEMGTLTDSFNSMLDTVQKHDSMRENVERKIRELNESLEIKVEARTKQLEQTNKGLRNALEDLQNAQSQLVQSEKMASLGGLVAGVAHEINTPIGIGVTASSHLQQKLEELKKQYIDGQMTRPDLENYLSTAQESGQIIFANLNRAAELIQGFKQVAVDQSSEIKRRFNLSEYIDEILISLRPKLKKTKHEVRVTCPEDLVIDSFPGAFSQIVTNFVVNSLIHGFDGIENGHINIDVRVQGSRILFVYQDDGVGVTEDVRDKIFEPFFTTKRGLGGSGLGTHVVYNLITQVLSGSIECNSAVGGGIRFDIDLPLP